jgi:DNA-binding NtrC family response regulator
MSSADDPGATREQRAVLRPQSQDAVKLIVIGEAAVNVVELPWTGEVIIGRDEGCEIALVDEAVSRRHARIMLLKGRATVEDFQSRNGTQLNGQPVKEVRPFEVGDALTIGGATLLLRRDGAPEHRRALPFDGFRARVDEEVERALRYERSFALLVLTAPALPTEALLKRLRSVDVVGAGEGTERWVLLPEIDLADPAALQTQVAAIVGTDEGTSAGYALCPTDACDTASLLAAARDAQRSGGPARVHAATESVQRYNLGEREAIAVDPVMLRIFALLRRVAASELPVLLMGESGTGKDVAAAAVHEWSPRRGQPFVVLNCAALPETLIESQLFGHDKGAFSGATEARVGVFEAAQGGTVFLDEIGEMSASAQAKLLRVIEAKKVTRLGENKERSVDVRVVAATNRNLERDVQAGTFRRDLYYRLSAAKVLMPPLRERRRELPVMAQRFLEQACAKAGAPPKRWSPGALRLLSRHPWPGNLRELKNVADYLAVVVLGDEIGADDLPPELRDASSDEFALEEPAGEGAQPAAGAPPMRFRSLQEELADLEKRRILEALEAAGGVQKHAAEAIGMPLRTFAFKLRRLQGGG